MVKFRAKVISHDWLTPEIFSMKVERIDDVEYKPGQFFMLSLDEIKFDKRLEKEMTNPVKRAYSTASTGVENEIEFCIKEEKDGTLSPGLAKLKVGDEVNVVGPYGRFLLKDDEKPIVLLAVGSGITPIMSMYRNLVNTKDKRNITFVFGNKLLEDVSYKDEIIELATRANNSKEEKNNEKIKLIFSITREKNQVDGFPTLNERIKIEKLKEMGIDFKNANIYMCGTAGFVKQIREGLEKETEKENIHYEIY